MGSKSLRRRALRVSLSLSVLLAVASPAAATAADARALGRCRFTIARESLQYTHRLDWRLSACLRQVAECRVFRRSGCPRTSGWCTTLARDVAALEQDFRNRVVGGCAGVPLASLASDLGFAEQMAACAVNSLDGFARCLASNLHLAEAAVVGHLDPTACDALAEAGMADVMPDESCGLGARSAPPPPPAAGPLACGGVDDRACPDGFVCDRSDPLCTQPAVAGACVSVPATCLDDGHPVCGCDGQTYASDCHRLRAGVTRTRDGACEPPESPCDFAHPTCPDGAFCDFPPGDCGEGGHGTCRRMRADTCLLCTAFVHGPQCGCDGMTYASDCERRAAGIPEWFEGACP